MCSSKCECLLNASDRISNVFQVAVEEAIGEDEDGEEGGGGEDGDGDAMEAEIEGDLLRTEGITGWLEVGGWRLEVGGQKVNQVKKCSTQNPHTKSTLIPRGAG